MVESGIWRATLTDSAGEIYSPDNGLSVRARVVQLYDSSPDDPTQILPLFLLLLPSFASSFFADCVFRGRAQRFNDARTLPRRETDFIPNHVNRRTCLATTVTIRKFSMHPAPSFHLSLKVSSTAILFSQRLRFMHR